MSLASTAPQREVVILPDSNAIAHRAAEEFLSAANEAVTQRGTFAVALAGGSTPKALYCLLASDPAFRDKLPWNHMHFFFGDERHVPPDHDQSNYRMANESLFSIAPIERSQVSRILAEYPDAEKAALEYEQALRAYFTVKEGEYPRFDLVLLGMGDEGHTLSLFPGTKALHASNRVVVRNWVGKLFTDRITLTAPAANQANRVMFMVTRSDKAPALKAVLQGPYEPDQLPAQLIQPASGRLLWLVDQAAGSMLAK
jgi:6-phosphogluconolactonase